MFANIEEKNRKHKFLRQKVNNCPEKVYVTQKNAGQC
jgi:hypothetical protein